MIDEQEYPATTADVVAAYEDGRDEAESSGQSGDASGALGDLLPRDEWFDSPEALRSALRRPDVVRALDRIEDAAREVGERDDLRSRLQAYERTLRALVRVDETDEDEGITVVTDWVVDRIREDGRLPRSRSVRHRAANYCRANGYPVRDDEWLGA